MGQEFIAPKFMMPIKFSISGYKNNLSFSRFTFTLHKLFGQVTFREEIRVVCHARIERDASRKRSIEEKDGHTATTRQRYQVWFGGIDVCGSLPGSKHSIDNSMLRK